MDDEMVVSALDAADPVWTGRSTEEKEGTIVGDCPDQHEQFAWPEKSFDVTILDQPSAMDDDHALAEFLDVAQEVAREQDRLAAGDEFAQEIVDTLLTVRVESVGRFVEQQKIRVGQQRVGEGEHLSHALGVGPERMSSVFQQADALEEMVDLGGVSSINTRHHR